MIDDLWVVLGGSIWKIYLKCAREPLVVPLLQRCTNLLPKYCVSHGPMRHADSAPSVYGSSIPYNTVALWLCLTKKSGISSSYWWKVAEPQHRATVYGRCGICMSHRSMGYGGTAPKFCMFHKRDFLPLPPVERTKLRSYTSVGSSLFR